MKIKVVLALIGICGAIGLAIVLSLKAPPPDFLAEAQAHYRKGEYGEAVFLYRKALLEVPAHLDAHREYQNAMRKLGKVGEIAGEYGAVVVRHPNEAWAHYLKARIAEPDKFREGMKKVLELDPGFTPAHLALARDAVDDKRLADAIPHFQKAFEKGEIDLGDLKWYCAACYGEKKFDEIDAVLARSSDFHIPQGLRSIGLPLGMVAGRKVLMLVPVAQESKVVALQFLKNERSYRMISVARNADGYGVSWTDDWEVLTEDQDPKSGKEFERRKDRPSLRELHEKAVTLLGPDEKKE